MTEKGRVRPAGPVLDTKALAWLRRSPGKVAFTRIGVLLATLAAFWLWSEGLAVQALWWDEGFSIGLASLPLPDLFREALLDVHPPLYYLLLKGWMALAGPTPFTTRLFSLLAGVLLIPLGYTFCRKAGVARAGLWAAVLLATAPFLLYYGREVRMYSLGMVLALLATNHYLDLLGGRRQRRLQWLLYGLLIGLGMWTHYLFVIVPLAHALGAAHALLRRKTALSGWLLAGGSALLLTLPWLLLARAQLGRLGANRVEADSARSGLSLGLSAAARVLAGYGNFSPPLIALTVLGLLLLAAGAVVLSRRRPSAGLMTLALLGGGLLVLSVVQLQEGEDVGRIVRLAFAAAPVAWLLMATGLAYLPVPARRGRLLLLLVLLGLAGYANQGQYARRSDRSADYRPLATNIAQLAEPGDAFLTTYLWQDGYLISYLPGRELALYRNEYSEDEVPQQLGRILADHRRLWVLHHEADVFDLSDPQNQWLHERLGLAFVFDQGAAQQALFVDYNAPAAAVDGEARLEQTIELAYRVPDETLTAPATLPVDLIWSAGETLSESLKVFIHLRESGSPTIVAQQDGLPVDGLQPTGSWEAGERIVDRRAVLIPAGVPAGEYTVYVGLYDPVTGERVPVLAQEGCREAESVCVGTVTIEER